MIDKFSLKITNRKGDTEHIRFNAVCNGEPYKLVAGEQYFFTVKKDTKESSAVLFQKTVSNPDQTYIDITITKQDTESLDYGRYVWDLRRKIGGEEITTPIFVKELEVAEVVGNNV